MIDEYYIIYDFKNEGISNFNFQSNVINLCNLLRD